MTLEEMDALVQRIDSTVGSRIDKICHSSLGSDFNQNQCAHYVSHLMGYDLSKNASCKYLSYADSQDDAVEGATIRVDVIFNKINVRSREKITRDSCYAPGLIFVTQARNIKPDESMGNMPAKHIGVLIWPWVYHYSNTANKVKKEHISQFMNTFEQVYGGNGAVVFYRGAFL